MNEIPNREKYLYARGLMKAAGHWFYQDVMKSGGKVRRYIKVKHLSEERAKNLYYSMVAVFGKDKVRLYTSKYHGRESFSYKDAVSVTLTDIWEDIKKPVLAQLPKELEDARN